MLTLKGVLLVAIVGIIAAGGAAYAARQMFDLGVAGSVRVATISTTDPIELFYEDGVTPVVQGSADFIDFGLAEEPVPKAMLRPAWVNDAHHTG